MRVERFVDQFAETAPLYGVSEAELRAGDIERRRVPRWIAVEDGAIRGAVVARRRPDDRLFLTFAGARAHCVEALSSAVLAHEGRSVHAFVDEADAEMVDVFDTAGFVVESILEGFRVPFGRVTRALAKWPVPAGFDVVTADEVDLDRLCTLDNTLRGEVPGCDGWCGELQLFRREFEESPPYEPKAYLIAVDRATGDYVGLIRVWRNATGPRIGLVGVARQARTTMIAAALLRQALTAAATWGHDSFVAETSPTNRVVHRRLERVGAVSTGRQLQLVRRPSGPVAHPG